MGVGVGCFVKDRSMRWVAHLKGMDDLKAGLRLSVLDQSPVPAGFTAGGCDPELDLAGEAGG